MESLTCKICEMTFKVEEVKLEKSGKHLKASCPKCGKYIKFLRQSEPNGDDIMPFWKISRQNN